MGDIVYLRGGDGMVKEGAEHTGEGFIILARSTYKNSSTWQNLTPEQKVVMITLLMMANHKENKWWDGNKFVTVKRGQLITSLDKLVKSCGKGITIKKTRTALEKLEKMGFLASKSTNQYRLINIDNYDFYQTIGNYEASERAKRGQSEGKARATNKNVKNVKNGKKDIYSVFDYWNTKSSLVNHKKNTSEIEESISKALKKYTVEIIREAIDRLDRANLDSEYFYQNRWALVNFLTQKNGIKNWIDEGQEWERYKQYLEQQSGSKSTNHNIDTS